MFGPPIWIEDETQRDRRRWYTQIWVFHRGVCELLAFTSVALLLAIGVVALGNAVSSDRTLPTAFESLGGAGIAFSVFGYLGPRPRDGLDFVQSAPVGLGTWATGSDEFGRNVSGIVVDVSMHPGLKIVGVSQSHDEQDHHIFVALRYSALLSESSRPADVNNAWYEQTVLRHLRRDPSKGAGFATHAICRRIAVVRSCSRVASTTMISLLGLAVLTLAILVVHVIAPAL